MNSYFERHSIRTLAMRFRGLASRNTIIRWLNEKRIRYEMKDNSDGPYLFKRSHLDDIAQILQDSHDRRVRKWTKSDSEFRAVRDKVRKDCLQTLVHNACAEFAKNTRALKREQDPALNDCDAVGHTCFCEVKPSNAKNLPIFRVTTWNNSIGKKGQNTK